MLTTYILCGIAGGGAGTFGKRGQRYSKYRSHVPSALERMTLVLKAFRSWYSKLWPDSRRYVQ